MIIVTKDLVPLQPSTAPSHQRAWQGSLAGFVQQSNGNSDHDKQSNSSPSEQYKRSRDQRDERQAEIAPSKEISHPLTSLRSQASPAQFSVRPIESLVAEHAQRKHFLPALETSTHCPCSEHDEVSSSQASWLS